MREAKGIQRVGTGSQRTGALGIQQTGVTAVRSELLLQYAQERKIHFIAGNRLAAQAAHIHGFYHRIIGDLILETEVEVLGVRGTEARRHDKGKRQLGIFERSNLTRGSKREWVGKTIRGEGIDRKSVV